MSGESGGGRKVLMVAFHFPPLHGSSGILRTLKFVRYLPALGFEPVVLSAHPRVYEDKSPALMGQIPAGVRVFRPLAFNVKKDLSFKGRYLSWMAVPDRYAMWIPFGILCGLYVAWTRRVRCLFSTYPIPSAHVIGLWLARITRLPWVADMRDPMWDDFFVPSIPAELAARRSIEAATVRRARRVLVTTPGMRAFFRKRYPAEPEDKFVVISNGYDENDFADLVLPPRKPAAPVTLVHMGLLEPHDRDPIPFFRGVKRMLDGGKVPAGKFAVNLYAPGNEAAYGAALRELGLAGIIRLLPSVPYKQAIGLMAEADALLLFQGPSCEDQIPAKLYEYLRVGRPVFALTTETGETGRTVADAGGGAVVPPGDPERIAEALEAWALAILEGRPLPAATRETALGYSRQRQAEQLAQCLAGL